MKRRGQGLLHFKSARCAVCGKKKWDCERDRRDEWEQAWCLLYAGGALGGALVKGVVCMGDGRGKEVALQSGGGGGGCGGGGVSVVGDGSDCGGGGGREDGGGRGGGRGPPITLHTPAEAPSDPPSMLRLESVGSDAAQVEDEE